MVQHSDVNNDLAVFVPGVGLVFHTHPAVAFVGALKVARRHGIGESEERGGIASRRPQPFQVETVLAIQHALQALTRNVALGAAIDRIADGHIVGRYGFGDRTGRAAHFEEPAGHLLAGSDLGKCPIAHGIQIDLQRLLVRTELWTLVTCRYADPIVHAEVIGGAGLLV